MNELSAEINTLSLTDEQKVSLWVYFTHNDSEIQLAKGVLKSCETSELKIKYLLALVEKPGILMVFLGSKV